MSVLESVREDFRKKLSTVGTNEMSEFGEFRKLIRYGFKKRNMEDLEKLLVLLTLQKYIETKKKNRKNNIEKVYMRQTKQILTLQGGQKEDSEVTENQDKIRYNGNKAIAQ